MDDVLVRRWPLRSIRGVTVKKDGFYTILINDDLSAHEAEETYRHELGHIERGDFESENDVDFIERIAHGY